MDNDEVDQAMAKASGATPSTEDEVDAAMARASQGVSGPIKGNEGGFSPVQAVSAMAGGTFGSILGGFRGLWDLASGQGADKATADIRASQEKFTPSANRETSEVMASGKNPLNWIPNAAKGVASALQEEGYRDPEMATFGDETVGTVTPGMAAAVETGINALPMVTGVVASKLKGAAPVEATEESQAAEAAQAEARQVGTSLSKGQATGDATQYAHEINQSKVAGGEPYADLFKQQNSDLLNHIDNTLGAKNALSPADAGQSGLIRLAKIDQQLDQAKNAAYGLVKDSSGRSATLDAEHFYLNAEDALERNNAAQWIPPRIQSLYDDVTEGRLPFTVDTMTNLDKTLSREMRTNTNGNEAYATGLLRKALSETPVSSVEGAQAIQAYQYARGLARQQFELADPTSQSYVPGYAAMLKGMGNADHGTFISALENGTANVDPAAWFTQNVMKATPAATNKLSAFLKTNGAEDEVGSLGQGALSAIRDQVVKGSDVRASVSADALNKVMDRRPSLQNVMPVETLDSLQKLANTATRIEKQPFRSGVNTSNTAPALQNLKEAAGAGARLVFEKAVPGGRYIMGAKDFLTGAAARNAMRQQALKDVNPDFTPEAPPPGFLQKAGGRAVTLSGLMGSGEQ